MKRAFLALLLVVFAVTALFGQSSPSDRGYTVITLPSGKSLAGDGAGGVCYITEEADPSINRWQSGQVEILVRQSQLDGSKFWSSFGVYPKKELEYGKILCFPRDPPLFLAYYFWVSQYEFPVLFRGTQPILVPNQSIKVQPVGQLDQLNKLFFGGITIDRSAGRDYMVAWIADSVYWEDIWLRVLELRQPLSQIFTLLRDSKDNQSQFSTSASSCTSGTGYWQLVAKSDQEPNDSSLIYYNRVGKMTVVKKLDTNLNVTPINCDASGVVLPYFENGVLKISRFNEGQYPSLETPLMVGSSFAGYRLTKIVSLKVSDDGSIFFISETDKGNVFWRLAPKSTTPEVIKAPGEAPFGTPLNIVLSGSAVIVHQQNGLITSNFLLTKEPMITNFKAEPATVEPGQPVKLSWDLIGQAKSLTLTPGIIAYTGAGHYEVTVYPAVTMPYTVKAEWVGGSPISKTVTVTVLPSRPAFSSASVVNSASGTTELSPGSLASIYGKGLSAQTTTAGLPLSLKLGGTQVQIEGVACPLLFVSEGQVNFIIPREIQPGKRKIVVIRDYIFSNEVEIVIADIAPSLFSISKEQGLFIDAVSYQLAGTKDNPLRKGGIYIVYANGLTSSVCNLKTGEPAPTDRLCSADGEISMKVGDLPIEVLFAGLAPGMLVYQINFRMLEVPGQVSNVVLVVDGKSSQPSPAFFEEEK